MFVAALAAAAQASDWTISEAEYVDRLGGMWFGQVLGNYAGRGLVPGESYPREGAIRRGGLDYDIGWSSLVSTDVWQGDDDTAIEYMYANSLAGDPDITDARIRQLWDERVGLEGLFIANRQAKFLMDRPDPDLSPPQTGGIDRNVHWYAIDSQITTETIGALHPGMMQQALTRTRQFARTTNDGYAVEAAQFYAALYAGALRVSHASPDTIESLVAEAAKAASPGGRTRSVIADVLAWYQTDRRDNQMDWRAAHANLYDRYGPGVNTLNGGRYRNWTESTINTGVTVLSLLYGQGDFALTTEIGVLSGFDADCNPAVAAGVVGLIEGYSGLDADLTTRPMDRHVYQAISPTSYPQIPLDQLALMLAAAGRQQVIRAGGWVESRPDGDVLHIPSQTLVDLPPAPTPGGARGLVGQLRALGDTVVVDAAFARRIRGVDRYDLDAVADGVTDVRLNGRLAYWSDDGLVDDIPGGDWYALRFARPVEVDRLVFYEGDVIWQAINDDPRTSGLRGGYFEWLVVEALIDGAWTRVRDVQFSEALHRTRFHQRIELDFAPVLTDAIRIRGQAGGLEEFTTIVELEAWGTIPDWLAGDANLDGAVTDADFTIWADNYGAEDATILTGDFNGDRRVTDADYTIWADNFGRRLATPAPATLLLLCPAATALLRRPQKTGR